MALWVCHIIIYWRIVKLSPCTTALLNESKVGSVEGQMVSRALITCVIPQLPLYFELISCIPTTCRKLKAGCGGIIIHHPRAKDGGGLSWSLSITNDRGEAFTKPVTLGRYILILPFAATETDWPFRGECQAFAKVCDVCRGISIARRPPRTTSTHSSVR